MPIGSIANMRRLLFYLLLVGSGLVMLFAPIPFMYREQVLCQPCDPSLPRSQCPKCPQKGSIGWSPSLFQMLLGRLSKSDIRGEMDHKASCKESGGKWLAKYKECENIDRQECNTLGGNFKECDSPCRHDTSATMCITLCVRVCTLH